MPSAVTDPQPPALRRHQAEALAAIETAWGEGRRRTWVVLPPGVGKTRLGCESVLRHTGGAVVFGPNTAIQTQWEKEAGALGIEVGVERSCTRRLTSLTYQSLAVFDPDAEVDDEGTEDGSLLARLHPNGRALVETLRGAGPILLVLDECHHLLEQWGRLLSEVLAELPEAKVLGLTATPPDALTAEQAELVQELFGETLYEATIPAAVREGALAPFAEAAWLVTPTTAEREWLQGQAERFAELVTQVTDPTLGTTSFLTWLDQRFVHADVGWSTLLRREPRLCAAALRMHHHGLVALPPGAGLGEEHRHQPDAEDWMVLLDDWIRRHLLRTGEDSDAELVEAIRRVLPSVGYVWTRAGIRPGRTPVDRVLARSAAKASAAVEIVRTEQAVLGERMRTLLLCDHERAGPTLSADLAGVLDPQSGAALALLADLIADPDLVDLRPLLVTGRTVAGTARALEELRDFVARDDPDRAGDLTVQDAGDGTAATLAGRWTSRDWLPWVTRFFESGRSRVLVGTRGLLGEGWDARRITGLVDLTAVTTTTAVVQARGRALRIDPEWPEKVAINWSVVCVAEDHPKGAADWNRLVRKHRGFLGVDDTGLVIDGVAHIDAEFSPYAPPAVENFDAVNARMVLRAEDRSRLHARWQVGAPYADTLRRAAWIRPRQPAPAVGAGRDGPEETLPAVVVAHRRLDVRPEAGVGRIGRTPVAAALAAAVLGAAGAALALGADLVGLAWALLAVGLVVAAGLVLRDRTRRGRKLLTLAAEPPDLVRIARAVAEALRAADLIETDDVRIDVDADGTHRCWLDGVDEEQSEIFATALDEALRPVGRARYLVPRWVVGPPPYGVGRAVLAAGHRVRPTGTVWHPVPSILGVRRERADAYAAAWRRWVGGGDPIWTGNPEGAGIQAAQQGSDPFEVTTVLRRHWS